MLIREMRLIKSTFFNAGILRTAAKYALNSEYVPISDMRLITHQYGMIIILGEVLSNFCHWWITCLNQRAQGMRY